MKDVKLLGKVLLALEEIIDIRGGLEKKQLMPIKTLSRAPPSSVKICKNRKENSDRGKYKPCKYCGGVEARPRSGRRSAVAETEMTGDAESHELTEWQGVGWVY